MPPDRGSPFLARGTVRGLGHVFKGIVRGWDSRSLERFHPDDPYAETIAGIRRRKAVGLRRDNRINVNTEGR